MQKVYIQMYQIPEVSIIKIVTGMQPLEYTQPASHKSVKPWQRQYAVTISNTSICTGYHTKFCTAELMGMPFAIFNTAKNTSLF